ncbi:MAG: phosphatase PAP2 family protein [Planctomycetes bacterium]|nr:phosphatase PAP2 family protein [Planctomycetota bacterium]
MKHRERNRRGWPLTRDGRRASKSDEVASRVKGWLWLVAGCLIAATGCTTEQPARDDWRERSHETVRTRLAAADAGAAGAREPGQVVGGSAGGQLFAEVPRFSLVAPPATLDTPRGSAALEREGVRGESRATGEDQAGKDARSARLVAPPPSAGSGEDPKAGRDARPPRLAADAVPGEPATTPAEEGQAEERAEGPAVERGPLPTLSETIQRDLRELPRVMWQDSKAAFGDPWNLVVLLGAGGASIALRTTNADYHIAEHYDRHNAFSGDWPDTFATLGNPAVHFALAGTWYLTGQQFQDAKTYEVGRKLFNALTITGVTTMFLKVAAWDYSPNGEWGAWPSGHVSSTMALATVLNDAYGPLVGVPMFGLTALVGVERLDDREHYLSDVVFGAVLGWVVAETVMKEHRPEIFGGQIVPYVDPMSGGAGIGWLKNLGPQPKKASTH